MIRRIVVACLLATAGCALAGCTSAPALKPRGTIPVQVEGEQKSVSVTARVEHVVAITLPPAGVGQRWDLVFHDSRFLKQLSELEPAPSADGRPGVTFFVLRTGRTRIRFALLPATATRVATPVDQREIVLTIE